MFRLFIISFSTFSIVVMYAQAPVGYYDDVTGTGYTLKTQLHEIIDDHNDQGYSALWTFYQTADVRGDGFVWDIYSDCDLTFVTDQDNGTGGTVECDKYNREHTFPQSWFGGSILPMRSDAHMVLPTDKKVNGERGSLPYSEVASSSYTSLNGSRSGTSAITIPGYSGSVFEPVDEYKGDIARIYFYMATRYEDVIATWQNNSTESDAVLNGSSDQVYEDWVVELLLTWHEDDPVSQKETDRNNDVQVFQGNRNPFVDHQEWVEEIWGDGSTDPLIEVSASNLNFGLVSSGENSVAQSYSVSGTGLSEDIVITTSSPFELSLDQNSWSLSVMLAEANAESGTNNTVYTRFSPLVDNNQEYNETITHTSTGAANVTVNVTGAEKNITTGNANELFFSEYIEGSGNNKALEIYNGTGASVDLSEYSVSLYGNGASSSTGSLALSGSLPDDEVYVIVNASANNMIKNEADVESSVTFFNGDDALGLFKDGTLIDMIGVIGSDPGSAWNDGDHSTSEKTLVRKSSIVKGNVSGFNPIDNLSDEWDVFDQDFIDDLGRHTFDPPTPTFTWDGSKNKEWSDSENWEESEVPSDNSNIIIQNIGFSPSINSTYEINDLEIQNGSELIIESGGALAIFGSVTGNGTATVMRNSTGDGGYSIIGSPVASASVSSLGADYAFEYDDAYVEASGTLTPGKGYFIGYDDENPVLSFSGTPNAGEANYAVTTGFQLIANPYTGAISIDEFQEANSSVIDGTVYFWDDGGSNAATTRNGSYVTVNDLGVVGSINLGGSNKGAGPASNGHIASTQGVFVNVVSAGDITFTPSMISGSSGDNDDANYYRISEPSTIKLSLSSHEFKSETLIGFMEGATLELDYALDAKKIQNHSLPVDIYTKRDGANFAIQTLPFQPEMISELVLTTVRSNTYSVNVEEIRNFDQRTNIYLYDIQTGIYHNLRELQSLEVFLPSGVTEDRYTLITTNSILLSEEDLDQELVISLVNRNLRIDSSYDKSVNLQIANLSGDVIFDKEVDFSEGPLMLDIRITFGDVYILRLGNKSTKFSFRN